MFLCALAQTLLLRHSTLAGADESEPQEAYRYQQRRNLQPSPEAGVMPWPDVGSSIVHNPNLPPPSGFSQQSSL